MRDHCLGRQSALDQPLRCRRLHHCAGARPARIFGPPRHQHPVLRRDDVEPLRLLLADHMHRPLAARARRVFGRNHDFDARQMRGQRWTLPLPRRPGLGRRGGMLGKLGLGPCHRLLDLFQRELQLVGIEPLRAAPEAGALELTKQVAQPIDLFDRTIALRNRGVTLRAHRIALGERTAHQIAQRFDVVGEEFGAIAHAQTKSDSRPPVAHFQPHRVNVSQRDRAIIDARPSTIKPSDNQDENAPALTASPAAAARAAHARASSRAPRPAPPIAPVTAPSRRP